MNDAVTYDIQIETQQSNNTTVKAEIYVCGNLLHTIARKCHISRADRLISDVKDEVLEICDMYQRIIDEVGGSWHKFVNRLMDHPMYQRRVPIVHSNCSNVVNAITFVTTETRPYKYDTDHYA